MRQIKIHYTIEFLSTLFTQWVFTLTPIYYVLKGHFNPFQLILIGVVLESTVLLFEIPTGYLANMYGLELGLIITALLHLFIVFALIQFKRIKSQS